MKALALFSGGLDSLLAIKIIENQNIEVIALHMQTGFIGKDSILLEKKLKESLKFVNASLEIVDIRDIYIRNILFSPKNGYGKNFNPCIDCHSKMFEIAISLLDKYNASFIISGEVLGQRPMSQNSNSIKQVEKISGSNGLLLRPLSAKLLPETIPVQEGWVDIEKLYDINGRSREMQINLAKEFSIDDFQSPGGGCLLTDISFSNRMKDFVKFDKSFGLKDIDIMKYGRHFRLPDGGKIIISRDAKETEIFSNIGDHKYLKKCHVKDLNGPLALIKKDMTEEDFNLSLSILLEYYKVNKNESYTIVVEDKNYCVNKMFDNKEQTHKYLVK
jgi:tRNA-specific 2-thiouridylase